MSCNVNQPVWISLLIVFSLFRIAEACSTRSTPKPRPPSPTSRPNVTFQTYTCPEAYAKWYCLNGATCFSVRIGESILYNCECADGYMGQRCEFKDLDGSYSKDRLVVEKAGLFGGGAVMVLFAVVFVILALKNHWEGESRKSNHHHYPHVHGVEPHHRFEVGGGGGGGGQLGGRRRPKSDENLFLSLREKRRNLFSCSPTFPAAFENNF